MRCLRPSTYLRSCIPFPNPEAVGLPAEGLPMKRSPTRGTRVNDCDEASVAPKTLNSPASNARMRSNAWRHDVGQSDVMILLRRRSAPNVLERTRPGQVRYPPPTVTTNATTAAQIVSSTAASARVVWSSLLAGTSEGSHLSPLIIGPMRSVRSRSRYVRMAPT